MPVLPAGMVTSLGATRPTRAGAPTLNSLICLRTCKHTHRGRETRGDAASDDLLADLRAHAQG